MTSYLKSAYTKAFMFFMFCFMITPTSVKAATLGAADLQPDDYVGVSFWVISMALVAATAFFFLEIQRVSPKWKTSLTVSGLVTLVAATHYFYMRNVWVTSSPHSSPTVYRYIDWLITVPLLMVEFFIILSAVTNVPGRVFWKLILGTLVMLIGGYLGEAGLMAATPAFVIGMVGWAYIIFEIYAGEAGQLNASSATPAVQSAFKLMRNIVVVGWAIYPLGYYFGYMTGGTKVDSNTLNLIYNLADFVNKIGFGVIIWKCAVSESDKR